MSRSRTTEVSEPEALIIDDEIVAEQLPLTEIPKPEVKEARTTQKPVTNTKQEETVNCLRNERIIVRHIPRQTGIQITNPKHVAYGGMMEGCTKTFTVPRLSNGGSFVNVLTNNEKAFLEEIMGLEYNALSVHKKPLEENFWSDANPEGIATVRLYKTDNYFDLSRPEEYIKYKILLANKDYIAKSLQELEDCPKATYQYVIISEGEEAKKTSAKIDSTMLCYKVFGKIEDDADTLRIIVEAIEGRPYSPSTKLDVLKSKCNDLIQANSKLFLKIASDELLPIKVLIRKSVEAGLIANRGNLFYLIQDGNRIPLCEDNQEPTLNIAAQYLASPRRQQLKFSLEAKIKETKE